MSEVSRVQEPDEGEVCRLAAAIAEKAHDAEGGVYHDPTAPQLVNGPYRTEGLTCPHGTTYYTQPTGEQIAQWARDGVR